MANKNFQVKHGLEVGTTVTADATTGNITTSGDVAVNGGDITTTAATANIVNTNATTVNIGGAATSVDIGASTGTTNINNNLDVDGNTVIDGDLTVDFVKAPASSMLTLQGDNILLNTLEAGAYDQLLNLNGSGYDFAINGGASAVLITNNGTTSAPFFAYYWFGDTAAGSNQITNCQIFAVGDTSKAVPLDWNTVSITGLPSLFGNSTDMFIPANQGYNFQLGVEVSSITINPLNNTLATVTLTTGDLATNANAASTITGAYGLFSEYVRNSTSTLVIAINLWNSSAASYGSTFYTLAGVGAFPVEYPLSIVPYQTPNYWSHTYTVAPTGYFLGRKRIDLEPTNPINESVNVNFGLGVGPNAVSTNRGIPADGIDAMGIAVLNDGSINGFSGKSAINTTQFKTNSFYQSGIPAERAGPYFTFNQFSNTLASAGNTWNPANGDGLGSITWYSRVNLAANLSSIFTPAGIWVKATEDWNNSTVKSGAAMYLQYTPNSAGAAGGRTWAMADDVTTQLRGGTSILLKPIAKSGSATSVAPVRGFTATQNHTWLTAEDYVAGNAFTNGQGSKVTVGITSSLSPSNGDVGLVLQRATGNTANFEWKLPTGTANELQLINNASGNIIADITDANITLESNSYNFKDASANNLLTIDSSGNAVLTGDLTINGNDIKSNGGTTAITLSTADVTIAGDLTINGNDIKSNGGTTAITLSNNDVTIPGDITTTGNRFSVTEGTNLLRVNIDNIEFYKTNASQKLMDIDALNSWNFFNDKYFFNYFNGTALAALDGTTNTAKFNFNNFRVWDTANANSNLDLDSGGNLIIRGDLRINGNDIKNSTGDTIITMNTGAGAVTIFAGDIRVDGNDIRASDASVNISLTSGTLTTFAGDIRVNGNDIQNSGGTAAITMSNANTTTTVFGDSIALKVAAGTAANSSNVDYTRTYGEFAYTNAAGFDIPAQNTIYTMPLDTTLNNSGVTISGTGNININVSGWYKIIMSLQVTLTVSNQPGQMDFWLRKNGNDVANSKTQVDLLKDQKAVIAMDWLVNSDGNDYWEIVYVGTTANYADIDFPTIAATTTPYVSPLAPALIVNVIPIGM